MGIHSKWKPEIAVVGSAEALAGRATALRNDAVDLGIADAGRLVGPCRRGMRLATEPGQNGLRYSGMTKSIERLDTLLASNPATERRSEPTDQVVEKTIDPLAATGPGVTDIALETAAVAASFPVSDWDRYEFLSLIGRGGMGAVYKARDRRLARLVALKFLRADDALFVARFQQEASTLARFDHPNICHIFEVGQVEGKPYLAMQFIDGTSLDQVRIKLSLYQKVAVIRDVALALHEAHRQGIVHRDVKPSNIMMERLSDGITRPVVMDFGIARESVENRGLTETGSVMGTPAYMSPEQARGSSRAVDRRADIYSLGATLYELLTGVPPFGGTDVMDVILAVLHDEPKPPIQFVADLPRDLDTIVLKCLAKEPIHRYDSARALAEELQRYIDGEPILGRRAGLFFRVRRQVRKNKSLFALGTVALCITLTLGVMGIRVQLQAQKQAELAQRLGQEISKMEWLMRSARQMPLHDLAREKDIIRRRMVKLEAELSGYGSLGRGLAHYALGRGHLALHEYPQALRELRQAQADGNESADVHYALGLVLGKHYEQAMYEARLSGGGDWAEKQLQEIEPKYLQPAIESLQKSRALASDTPGYLEAMIAYYRRDYEGAIRQAKEAGKESPWLYEAAKLQGDIHFERALKARDSGKDEQAKQEFGEAVKKYQEAAQVGQSDAEVYEGLAEAWVRQVEMAATRGQPTEVAYAAAIESSDKITAAEPTSTAGPLKKAYAALMTMAISGSGTSSAERVQKCLSEAQVVLVREPENPYASDVAAACNAFAADGAQGRGEDPEPLFRRAIALLEPAVERTPHFLWGLNDMAGTYLAYASFLQLHGSSSTRGYLEKAVNYEKKAMALDESYLIAIQNALFTISRMVMLAQSSVESGGLLTQADDLFERCKKKNGQYQQCYINYLSVYARAAQRAAVTGQAVDGLLKRAKETLVESRKLGGAFLDLEQHAALIHLLEVGALVRDHRDPTQGLGELQNALGKCLAINGQDAMCKTLSAQAGWVSADWANQQKQSGQPQLEEALRKAQEATKSPETYPDAWQVVAETYLRLARLPRTTDVDRLRHLRDGHSAMERCFTLNPRHALGLVTRGELLVAEAELDLVQRQRLAEMAVTKFSEAISSDPLLSTQVEEKRRAAERLVRQ